MPRASQKARSITAAINDRLGDIHELILTSTDGELEHLEEWAQGLSRTNCWWLTFHAKQLLTEVLNDRRRMGRCYRSPDGDLATPVQLYTVGRIAGRLNVPVGKVRRVIRTMAVEPAAKAGPHFVYWARDIPRIAKALGVPPP